jgi:hypothetical protein
VCAYFYEIILVKFNEVLKIDILIGSVNQEKHISLPLCRENVRVCVYFHAEINPLVHNNWRERNI